MHGSGTSGKVALERKLLARAFSLLATRGRCSWNSWQESLMSRINLGIGNAEVQVRWPYLKTRYQPVIVQSSTGASMTRDGSGAQPPLGQSGYNQLRVTGRVVFF